MAIAVVGTGVKRHERSEKTKEHVISSYKPSWDCLILRKKEKKKKHHAQKLRHKAHKLALQNVPCLKALKIDLGLENFFPKSLWEIHKPTYVCVIFLKEHYNPLQRNTENIYIV